MADKPPNDCAPLCFTYSPILSAEAGSRPFSSVISRFTSDHGDYPQGSARIDNRHVVLATLSNLSTADDIGRIFSGGTPQTSNIPSRIFLWLICAPLHWLRTDSRVSKERTLIANSPISSRVRIVHSKLSSSASGIIVSHWPEMSKSWGSDQFDNTLARPKTMHAPPVRIHACGPWT